MGVMGAGLAKQIRDKFPRVYEQYRRAYERDQLALGKIQVVRVTDTLSVANLCAQEKFGREKIQYTDYPALETCLEKLATWKTEHRPNADIYFPKNMGCGFGGGQWWQVMLMIAKHFPTAIIATLPDSAPGMKS